jgi:hypothetical protein
MAGPLPGSLGNKTPAIKHGEEFRGVLMPLISYWGKGEIGVAGVGHGGHLAVAAAVELGGVLRYTGHSQLRGPQQPGLLAPG